MKREERDRQRKARAGSGSLSPDSDTGTFSFMWVDNRSKEEIRRENNIFDEQRRKTKEELDILTRKSRMLEMGDGSTSESTLSSTDSKIGLD